MPGRMVGADAATVVPASVGNTAPAGVVMASTERKLSAMVPAAHAVATRRNLPGPCFMCTPWIRCCIKIVVTAGHKSPQAHSTLHLVQLASRDGCDTIFRISPNFFSLAPNQPAELTFRQPDRPSTEGPWREQRNPQGAPLFLTSARPTRPNCSPNEISGRNFRSLPVQRGSERRLQGVRDGERSAV